jgi:microcystin-dependent protein
MDAFLGEVRLFCGTYAPVGWVQCNGQVLPISENEALYTLLGTVYGGDGVSTFGVPDLRGRVPVHQGTYPGINYPLGAKGGVETVTLTPANLPVHSHSISATNLTGNTDTPASSATWATPGPIASAPQVYSTQPNGTMDPRTVSTEGGGVSHENMMPFLSVMFIMCVQGLFPSQS